jgi:hypothetical protein
MGENIHWIGKLLLYTQFISGKETEKTMKHRGISLLTKISGKIFSGILAGRLRDWLIYHKALPEFKAGFIKSK